MTPVSLDLQITNASAVWIKSHKPYLECIDYLFLQAGPVHSAIINWSSL
jgi:hypothetical protein